MSESHETWVDYYRVLLVPEDADADEIKRAYRRMARRYHPDVDRTPDAAERFLLIQAAFDVLSDSERRAAYDEERRARQKREEARSGPVTLRWTLSRHPLPCHEEAQIVYALVDIVATAALDSGGLPLNLCLLLDCSSSMRATSVQRLREAARLVVDQLTEHDNLSLVAFHDRAQVLVPNNGPVDLPAVRAALNTLQARGGTEIAQGLAAALKEVRRRASPRHLSHIVFLTDGYTYGDDELCRDLARQAGAAGISISALGLGANWNEALMDDVAALSGGVSRYIDAAEGIAPVFHEQIQRLRDVIVRDAALELEPRGGGTVVRAAHRFFPAIAALDVASEGQLLLPMGNIERSTGQTVLIEFQVPPLPTAGPVPLAGVRLLGRMATAQSLARSPLVQADLATTCEWEPENPPLDSRLRGFAERVVAYRLQERAWRDLAEEQVDQATSRLRSVATKLLELGEVDLARETIREAKRLEATGQTSLIGRKRIRYGTRSLTSLLPWHRPMPRSPREQEP